VSLKNFADNLNVFYSLHVCIFYALMNIQQAIELELQKIEAQQAKKHVQLLSAFLPEAFLRRGG